MSEAPSRSEARTASGIGVWAELAKPRLSAMAVFAVIAGLFLGSAEPPSLQVVLACVFATFAVAAGGNALNMFLEREHDSRMPRTKGRPLPTGRLRPPQVLAFGLLSAALGLAVLSLATNALATTLCAAIFVTYVLVYTPLKRVTTLNTLVGAVPGALPPLVGYAAGNGALDMRGAMLFLILFFWQIPHFLAIAWRYRDDYRAGGMVMLPVVDRDGRFTAMQMVVYTVALIATTLFASVVGLGGPLYLVVAICLGVLFLVPVILAATLRAESAMRMTFLVSIIYLPLLLCVMVLDQGMR